MGRNDQRDRGAVLVLALVLTVVLSIIVLGLATYVSTGLRTSKVSTDRTETTAAATAGIYFVVERLSTSSPFACDAAFAVPTAAVPGDIGVAIVCSKLTTTESPAQYRLESNTSNGHVAGDIVAVVSVREEMAAPRGVRVIDWSPANG
jgi:Tfp pilus assembly protein PilX